jgi:hypothetical protein
MNSIVTFLIARLQEPSTYASLSLLLGGLGLHVSDAAFQAVAHTLAAVAALAGVLMSEKKHTTNAAPTVPPQNP